MDHEQLIIFTRYPEPGKTKTRMIPKLGEEGAARLQRRMTEHTIKQARKLFGNRTLWIEVHFTGGNQFFMQEWLGSDLVYKQQDKGDLGQRMKFAFQQSFAAGMQRIVMIGIDCPDVNQSILDDAFEALKQNDLVVGPAEDGGYYLIGLSRFIPELFTGIDWGTATVLAKTKETARQLALTINYLPLLKDVDRPEDLEIWERYKIK